MKYWIGKNEYKDYKKASLEDCLNYCRSKSVLGLDIETSRNCKKNLYNEQLFSPGLDPWLTKICMLQIGDLENQFVIDVRDVDISPLKEIIESDKILKVGHNLKFEFKHLYIGYGMQLTNVWDTMVCEKVLYNGYHMSFSLENLAYRYLNAEKVNNNPSLFDSKDDDHFDFDDFFSELDLIDSIGKEPSFKIDKSIRLDFVEIGDKPFTQAQLDYATDDIIMPLLIRDKQKEGIWVTDTDHYKPDLGFRLENAFSLVAAKIELKGLKVNIEGWKELYEKNIKVRYDIKKMLDDFVINNYPTFANQLNLFEENPTCSIEWESSQQVVKFFKYLGFCPREYSKQTKKIDYTVGAKALIKLLRPENKDNFFEMNIPENIVKDDNNQSLILTYLLYKKYQLLTTTFGLEWLKYIHPITGRVHTNFKTMLNTGRMASTNPNLVGGLHIEIYE